MTLYFKELWHQRHAELIAIVAGVGFWVADNPDLSDVSGWGIGVVAVLFIYLIYILRDTFQVFRALYRTVELPFSIVTNKSNEEAEVLFRNHMEALSSEGVRLRKIFDRLLISNSDWRYFDQQEIADEDWDKLVRDIRAHFIRLSKRISRPARYNFFFVTPPAVALGLGAVIGRNVRCRAYQYFGPERFVAVFDPERNDPSESYHRGQALVQDFEEIEISESGDPRAPNAAITLQFVGHPLSEVRAVVPEPCHFLKVQHRTYRGHLPPDHNWMSTAAEISSLVLSQLEQQKTVHMFVGLPAALAFAVGNFIGDHNIVKVYHHDRKRAGYVKVFALNKLS